MLNFVFLIPTLDFFLSNLSKTEIEKLPGPKKFYLICSLLRLIFGEKTCDQYDITDPTNVAEGPSL